MITYANGDKDVISDKTAEPKYSTGDAEENLVSERVANRTRKSSRQPMDKWGRTEAQNRAMKKKKVKTGAVLLGVGTLVAGAGGALIGIYAMNGSTSSTTVGSGTRRSRTFTTFGLGLIFSAGGTAMLVSGAVILGTSNKFIKRANELANGKASFSPSIMNIHSYSGTSINSQAGYGLSFNYKF